MSRRKTILTRDDREKERREGLFVVQDGGSVGGIERRCSVEDDLFTLPCRTDMWKRTWRQVSG